MRTAHQSGFAHRVRVRVSCEDCLANGRVMKRCETCGGRGYVEEWRCRDPYAKNETVQPYGIDDTVKLGHVPTRDAELARLEQQTAPAWKSPADELDDANRHPYGWEIARKVMYDRFDYRALDVAIDDLLKSLPGVSPRSERGLTFLLERMPVRIRAPKKVVQQAAQPVVVISPAIAKRIEREEQIRELAANGLYGAKLTAAEIAAHCKCSLKTVYRALEAPQEAGAA